MTEKNAGDGKVVRIVRFVKSERSSLPTEPIIRKLFYPFLAPSGWKVRGSYFGKVVLIMLEGPRSDSLEASMELFSASIKMREKRMQEMDFQEWRKIREEEMNKNESTEFASISFFNNWSFPYSGSSSGMENQIFDGMVLKEITDDLPENLGKAKAIMQRMATGLAAATK